MHFSLLTIFLLYCMCTFSVCTVIVLLLMHFFLLSILLLLVHFIKSPNIDALFFSYVNSPIACALFLSHSPTVDALFCKEIFPLVEYPMNLRLGIFLAI